MTVSAACPTIPIAVVGATGQLGRALLEAAAGNPRWKVFPLSHDSIEVSDEESVARALGTLDPAPAVVVNTAFTFVEEPDEALRVNALGAALLAEWCTKRGTRLFHISTDYVFDGEQETPYRETDRAEPRSVYGISKLAGERLVRLTGDGHLVIRISNLYGTGGSRAKRGRSFVSDMLDMHAQGKPLRVVTDQIHSPTFAGDAATTILDLIASRATGVDGTVHLSNTGACSKHAFAEAIFRFAGIDTTVEPIRLSDLPPGPHRPRHVVFAHHALERAGLPLPPPWEEGLRRYLIAAGITSGTPRLAR